MFTPEFIGRLKRATQDDPETRLALRHASFTSLLEFGDQSVLVTSREGDVDFVPAPGQHAAHDFAVRGSAEALTKLRAAATPLTNHPVSMATQQAMAIGTSTPSYLRFEGDERKLYANMFPLCAILALLRKVGV
jgi:hypothetical protein